MKKHGTLFSWIRTTGSAKREPKAIIRKEDFQEGTPSLGNRPATIAKPAGSSSRCLVGPSVPGSLNECLNRTECRNLPPIAGAHVFGIWQCPDSSEVKTIGVPASANRRVIAQPTMRVPCASVVEKFEMLVAEIKQHTPKTRGIGSSPRTVRVLPPVMLSSGIVKHGKQPDHLLNGAALSSNQQSIALDTPPVRRPMDRTVAALKLTRDVIPNPLPIDVHQAVHVLVV
jgi:hypothetical protein